MIPRPPRSTRTDTLLPYTTRCRSADAAWPGVTRQNCAVAGNIPDMRCGYIEVLENRAAAGGKAIRIAVAVFLPDHRAGWFAEPPLPLVFLSGGPGSATDRKSTRLNSSH